MLWNNNYLINEMVLGNGLNEGGLEHLLGLILRGKEMVLQATCYYLAVTVINFSNKC